MYWASTLMPTHLTFCYQVCEGAGARNCRPFRGFIYDKIARKQWSERAAANEGIPLAVWRAHFSLRVFRISMPSGGFDVSDVCKEKSEALLLHDINVYNSLCMAFVIQGFTLASY